MRDGAAAPALAQPQTGLQFIYARRSIRKFQLRPVAVETLRELVRAAMAAPSACAKNPWEFIVVTDKATLETIAGFLPNGKFLPQAAAAIVVCGDQAKAHAAELSFLLQDCSAAVQNILLAACQLGLGACWLGVHPRQERIDRLQQLWHLPPSVLPIACLAIGWPAEEKPPRTNFQEEAVHWQQW
ncbi:MAG: nitroreductase family protein [Oligosphaeraceae bacterium]|nr:nitroreductase family protein [Oligosphaeraceae bacterium]